MKVFAGLSPNEPRAGRSQRTGMVDCHGRSTGIMRFVGEIEVLTRLSVTALTSTADTPTIVVRRVCTRRAHP